MRMQGKIAVVTGASMGIGEAIAKALVDEGAKVVLSARDAQRLEAARARIGRAEQTSVCVADVSRVEDLRRLLEFTLERYGRVDIWVNNAGFGLNDSIEKLDMNEFRRMFDTNVFGAVAGMQVAARAMRQQGGGAIVNISSVAGHVAVPHMGPYSASKFALNALGYAAGMELADAGVHVMTVCPGYIATDFAVNMVKGEDRKRLSASARPGISAERVARAVINGLLKRKRQIVVPWRDWIFVWLYRVAPWLMESTMRRMLRPSDEVIAQARAAARPKS